MTILDTCIWVALLNNDDSCHGKAAELVLGIDTKDIQIFDYTYGEVLTVLRNKADTYKCSQFKNFLKDIKIDVFFSDINIFNLADKIFFQNPKLSFIDCLTLATAKIHNSKFHTFDKELQKVALVKDY